MVIDKAITTETTIMEGEGLMEEVTEIIIVAITRRGIIIVSGITIDDNTINIVKTQNTPNMKGGDTVKMKFYLYFVYLINLCFNFF